MLEITNDAILIHTNMKKEDLKNKITIDEGGKNDSYKDDKLMSFRGQSNIAILIYNMENLYQLSAEIKVLYLLA